MYFFYLDIFKCIILNMILGPYTRLNSDFEDGNPLVVLKKSCLREITESLEYL